VSAVDLPDSASPSDSIFLHAAAAKMSTSTRVGVFCNCKPSKCSGRCRCVKNNVKCSVRCHFSEFDCGNLSSLLHRTEIALPVVAISLGTSAGTVSGRKRAATSTTTKTYAPKRTRNRQPQATTSTVPIKSESLDSNKSWIENEKCMMRRRIWQSLE
jgi:hypothetical protein